MIEAIPIQAGPLLSAIGIDQGIQAGNMSVVLLAVAVAAILRVVISAVAGGIRVALTGRIASRVMFELRVRVFAHLQRLSLDYFTGEKAGVIMTRIPLQDDVVGWDYPRHAAWLGERGVASLVVRDSSVREPIAAFIGEPPTEIAMAGTKGTHRRSRHRKAKRHGSLRSAQRVFETRAPYAIGQADMPFELFQAMDVPIWSAISGGRRWCPPRGWLRTIWTS